MTETEVKYTGGSDFILHHICRKLLVIDNLNMNSVSVPCRVLSLIYASQKLTVLDVEANLYWRTLKRSRPLFVTASPRQTKGFVVLSVDYALFRR